MEIKRKIPWQAKIVAKLVLSRVPVGYQVWQRLSLFKHGEMERPEYAYNVFRRHFDRAGLAQRNTGFVALELGPGDSLFSALIARAFGASECYLVDVGRFARDELQPYQAMVDFLLKEGLPAADMKEASSLDELLTICSAHYLTSGLSSLRTLPDQSVDFIWSQAVLEHVRHAEFLDVMCELRRIVRPDGICSHRVDLRDHLGGALNNLRFARRLWESDFMSSSGFYTNRLRFSEMLDLFHQAGFHSEVTETATWDKVPTPRNKLAEEFRHLPDSDLRVSNFDVILRPA